MSISKEQLEKMTMWHSTVALMGIDHEDLDNWGDECFTELLDQLEQHYERVNNPDDIMKAVLQTHNMGISLDEVNEYVEHLNKVQEQLDLEERNHRIATNEHIVSLRQDYDFKWLNLKQYAHHKNFEFKNKKGLTIRGRVFRYNWATMRVWLYWTDKKGKACNLMNNFSRDDIGIELPAGFPLDWVESIRRYTFDSEKVSYIIAHRVVHKKMGKGFIYPKA